ncbi:hypothetical protein HDU97_010090 [Phlyctochytrium planicorne]|nr:hypothetical protein HDU97_010090 [Phlyctochytrium planicorne]
MASSNIIETFEPHVMAITLFGWVKIPVLLAKPEPVGTTAAEFKSTLYLYGGGEKGSIGIPLSFTPLVPETAESKENREKRRVFQRNLVRKIVWYSLWTIVTIAILGALPAFQIFFLRFLHETDLVFIPSPDLQQLSSPLLFKKASVRWGRGFNQNAQLAVFSGKPSRISAPFVETVKTHSGGQLSFYSTEVGLLLLFLHLLLKLMNGEKDVSINVKSIHGTSRADWILFITSGYKFTELNITDSVNTPFDYHLDDGQKGSHIFIHLYKQCPDLPESCDSDIDIEISGSQFVYNVSEATQLCESISKCKFDMNVNGFSKPFAYVPNLMWSDHGFSFLQVEYDRRIATFSAYFFVMILFFAALAHALYSLWVHEITLWDRVKGLAKKRDVIGFIMASSSRSIETVEPHATAITLFGWVKIPLLLAKPEPVGTTAAEFKSTLYLYGGGEKGSIGIPLSFTPLVPETAESKENREKRRVFQRNLVRKIVWYSLWTIVTFAILGALPAFQIFFLEFLYETDSVSVPSPDLQQLSSPIWYKRASVNWGRGFQQNTQLALFSGQPSRISAPFV